jgi:hypothetical protein
MTAAKRNCGSVAHFNTRRLGGTNLKPNNRDSVSPVSAAGPAIDVTGAAGDDDQSCRRMMPHQAIVRDPGIQAYMMSASKYWFDPCCVRREHCRALLWVYWRPSSPSAR